ncbi:PREDICTED: uncharacterized protein LOC104753090 [Camelina sativa]|uniref:Uncharacterized protein LOC104753090 n=1 Tax=Camelina sativa TaxID=90675 RepID=A0ABM0WNJ3_CAMSA|nr:PREDICTED: uncharacterized protein LOC104753090 [Camelina sativa]
MAEYEASLKFLYGEHQRLRQTSAEHEARFDSLDLTLKKIKQTLSALSNHLEKRSMQPESSHQALQLPIFIGGDPKQWIARIEAQFVGGECSEKEKLAFVSNFLGGQAKSWFHKEQSWIPFNSWNEVKDGLLLMFGNDRDQKRVGLELDRKLEQWINDFDRKHQKSENTLGTSVDVIQEIESSDDIVLQAKLIPQHASASRETFSQFQCALQVFGTMTLRDKRRQQRRKQSKHPKAWRFKFKMMSRISHLKDSCSFASVGSNGKHNSFKPWRRMRQSPQSQFICKMRMRLDLRGLYQLCCGEVKFHMKRKWTLQLHNTKPATSPISAATGLEDEERHTLKSHKRMRHTHMNWLMCISRLRLDSSSMKQFNTSDMQPKFWSKVESGDEIVLALEEAQTGIRLLPSSAAQFRLQENVFVESVFHSHTVLKASPMVYGKLHLQTRVAMDIPEHAVSSLRVPAFNTLLEDRDATIMTHFLHGDERFQVFHKWRSKALRFWRRNIYRNKYHVLFSFVQKMKASHVLVVTAIVWNRKTHLGIARLKVWHRWKHKVGKLQPCSEFMLWSLVHFQSGEGISLSELGSIPLCFCRAFLWRGWSIHESS